METTKSAVATLKADKEPGVFTAEFSVFGNVDSDGDIVHRGAFKEAFETMTPAVVWTHMWQIPPIGETLEARETETGAQGKARLFLKEHELAPAINEGIKTGALKQYSYRYDLDPGGFEVKFEKDLNREIRHLTKFSLIPEWGPTLLGANQLTSTLDAPKSRLLRELLGKDSGSEAWDELILSLLLGEKSYDMDADEKATVLAAVKTAVGRKETEETEQDPPVRKPDEADLGDDPDPPEPDPEKVRALIEMELDARLESPLLQSGGR